MSLLWSIRFFNYWAMDTSPLLNTIIIEKYITIKYNYWRSSPQRRDERQEELYY